MLFLRKKKAYEKLFKINLSLSGTKFIRILGKRGEKQKSL